MKEMGSIKFYDDIDLSIKFDFEDLMNYVFENKFVGKNETEDSLVKDTFFNNDGSLNMSLVDKYVESYVNQKIKEKFGENYSLDVMDDTTNISWDIKVDSIKKHEKEDYIQWSIPSIE